MWHSAHRALCHNRGAEGSSLPCRRPARPRVAIQCVTRGFQRFSVGGVTTSSQNPQETRNLVIQSCGGPPMGVLHMPTPAGHHPLKSCPRHEAPPQIILKSVTFTMTTESPPRAPPLYGFTVLALFRGGAGPDQLHGSTCSLCILLQECIAPSL